MKRLATLVAVVLASSTFVNAQQLASAMQPRTIEQTVKVAGNVELGLVGLTKSQVEARLGKPSASFDTIWNYKQPKGTLHVRFSRHGIVSDAKIDVEPRSSAKG